MRRHNDVKLKMSTSLCMVMNATFTIKHWKSEGMQEKESNISIRYGWKIPSFGITVSHHSAKPRVAKQLPS